MGIAGLLLVAAAPVRAAPDAESAKTLVQNTTRQVFDAMHKQSSVIDHDPAALYKIINDIVLPHFDFRRMTQRVIGRYWQRATPDQQATLTRQFELLLVRTYATAIRDYNGQPIKYLPVRPGDGDVTVRTEVQSHGGPIIPIGYEMYAVGNDWKVYDVVIDGVSLVINYRASFTDAIRAGGIDGLIKRLEAKNAENAQ
jgi:phospholipid transport system substrate-binding protein